MLDQFHLLKSIRKKLADKNNIELFRDVMFSKSPKEVYEALTKIEAIADPQFQRYLRRFFYENLAMFSEIFSANNFHGLSISTSPCEKINDMLKKLVRYETTVKQLVLQV